MVSRLKKIKEIRRIIQSGQDIGDAAALKLTILSKDEGSSPYRDWVIQHRELNFIRLNPARLEMLPRNSFGFAYAQFMRRNNLKPFNFSEKTAAIFDRYPVSIRYARIHDMVHTLLSFEPTIAGELGVYAFVGSQKYTPMLNRAALTAKIVGGLFWWKGFSLIKANKLGREMGLQAQALVTVPLEKKFSVPLAELRTELGIKLNPQLN